MYDLLKELKKSHLFVGAFAQMRRGRKSKIALVAIESHPGQIYLQITDLTIDKHAHRLVISVFIVDAYA